MISQLARPRSDDEEGCRMRGSYIQITICRVDRFLLHFWYIFKSQDYSSDCERVFECSSSKVCIGATTLWLPYNTETDGISPDLITPWNPSSNGRWHPTTFCRVYDRIYVVVYYLTRCRARTSPTVGSKIPVSRIVIITFRSYTTKWVIRVRQFFQRHRTKMTQRRIPYQ